jgi:hypothetical protein
MYGLSSNGLIVTDSQTMIEIKITSPSHGIVEGDLISWI